MWAGIAIVIIALIMIASMWIGSATSSGSGGTLSLANQALSTAASIGDYNPYGRKIVAVLELTNENAIIDTPIAVSLKYCANLNGVPVEIVDSSPFAIEDYPKILDALYADGYRIFIGFSRCREVAASLPWFEDHRDTVAITLINNCTETAVVGKNMIRLTVSNIFPSFYTAQFAIRNGYKDVWLITSNTRTTGTNMRDSITAYLRQSGQVDQIHQVDVTDVMLDPSSRDAISAVFNDIPATSLIIILLQEDIQVYVDLVEQVNVGVIPTQIYPFSIQIAFSSSQASLFDGKFYQLVLDDVQDQTNVELAAILGKDFQPDAYDALNIARIAQRVPLMDALYTSVDHLVSHSGVLSLNNMNDQKYADYSLNLWAQGTWSPFWFVGNNPTDGIYISSVLYSQIEM